MGLKPHALNRGDEVHLGWELDRRDGLVGMLRRFTLAHNASQGKKKGLARWTIWTNGKPIFQAQIIFKEKNKEYT